MTDIVDSQLTFAANCPVPLTEHPTVQMAHGGGGRMSQRLIADVFASAFDNPWLREMHDGAILELGGERLAFTTDGHVVKPLFFPGGDIGSLAVHGTVNDLAVCGALPIALSASFILEEGYSLEELRRVVASMSKAANSIPVPIVTGDTKVVDRGKGDGVYISTSAVGRVHPKAQISPRHAKPGDIVLLSGEIAAHGIAVLSARENLGLQGEIASDTASILDLVWPLFDAFESNIHVLRDPTRGGVAAVLNEIAMAAQVGIEIDEVAIPVSEPVRGACELLGLDPLYVANEGKCVAIVDGRCADAVLANWQAHPLGHWASRLGAITESHPGVVTMRSAIGATRVVDLLSGEQLPRIC
jgi:hydrogenase expression/formation protein HypE